MLTYQDKTKFEKQLEIPIGQNTLKITAVDINNGKSGNFIIDITGNIVYNDTVKLSNNGTNKIIASFKTENI